MGSRNYANPDNTMFQNRTPYLRRARITLSSLCLISLTAPSVALFAQNASTEEEEVVHLSPFVVDSSGDQGYQTTNTLSGNRMNTENRYVGASVTEVTGQLLEDLNINDFTDALNFVPNSAPAESGGLSADPTGNESIFGVRYRVRGFLLTGFSRDFFKTRIAPDAYNTERMSFSRGPNSVLFGIGEPGGITNAVSSRAEFRNANRVGVRFDTWDSTRYFGSFNRELIEDKLALKVAAVYNDHRNHRNPWYNRSERVYGALTFKPFKDSTLRFHHEAGETEILNSRSWAPSDAVSVWQGAGSQSIPANRLNVTSGAGRSTGAERQSLGMQEFRGNAPWNVVTTGNVASLNVYQSRWELITAQKNVSGFNQAGNGGVSFTDDSIIPQTANVLGKGNKNVQDFSNTTIVFEQKILEDLYLEVAYNKQDTESQPDFSAGSRDHVYLDILPSLRVSDPGNPMLVNAGTYANPNVGKYFTWNETPVVFDNNYDDETIRAMLSYELDLRKSFDGVLGKILGHHNLAGMFEHYQEQFVNQAYHFRNSVRSAGRTGYLGPNSWVGVQNYIDIPNGNYTRPDIAQLYPRVWQENESDIPDAGGNAVVPFWAGVAGTNSISETTSSMFAMQNYFWDNKVVGTFGWRSDDVDSWNVNRAVDPVTQLRSNVSLVDPKTGTKMTSGGDTYSAGLVLTPVKWLGLFYNESSNFRPSNAGTFDIFGDALGDESGEGKDYGIKFFLMDGKLTGSVAWFETSFVGQSTRGPRVGPVGSFDAPRASSRAALRDYFTDILNDPVGAELWSEPGYFDTNYFATQDFSSEGWEFSLTANPTANWRLTANISQQENVSSNVAPRMREWTESIRTLITDPALLALETTTLSSDGVNFNTVAENFDLADQRIREIASLEGFADQRQPELSANLVTAYDFTEGVFKNMTLGGNYRWRDSSVVGYELLAGGGGALDATKPYFNESNDLVGLFVAYRTKMFKDVGVRFQINVDNVFDANESNVLLSRQVGGQRIDSRWSLGEGRSFAFSATFNF